MEQVNGGKVDVNACSVTLWAVGTGIGALGLVFTSGAAAGVMFVYSSWIGALGAFLC